MRIARVVALVVLVAGCGTAPPVPRGAVDPGPVATVAQYAAIITRYGLVLRADAAALATCDPDALSTSCAETVRRAADRGGLLSAALAAANLSGSATYIGAPPHPIAGLVADTLYDSGRLATFARAYRPGADLAALTATLADLVLELDAWTAYGVSGAGVR
jgi:hypothetical protein